MEIGTFEKQHQALVAGLAQRYQQAENNASRPTKGHTLWNRVTARFSWYRQRETFEQGMRKVSFWMGVSCALNLLAALLSLLLAILVHGNGSQRECVQATAAVSTVGQCVPVGNHNGRN